MLLRKPRKRQRGRQNWMQKRRRKMRRGLQRQQLLLLKRLQKLMLHLPQLLHSQHQRRLLQQQHRRHPLLHQSEAEHLLRPLLDLEAIDLVKLQLDLVAVTYLQHHQQTAPEDEDLHLHRLLICQEAVHLGLLLLGHEALQDQLLPQHHHNQQLLQLQPHPTLLPDHRLEEVHDPLPLVVEVEALSHLPVLGPHLRQKPLTCPWRSNSRQLQRRWRQRQLQSQPDSQLSAHPLSKKTQRTCRLPSSSKSNSVRCVREPKPKRRPRRLEVVPVLQHRSPRKSSPLPSNFKSNSGRCVREPKLRRRLLRRLEVNLLVGGRRLQKCSRRRRSA